MWKKDMINYEELIESLIILKNTIKSGNNPGPDNLEIGELALTLFKGEEGAWVKNSEGEVINLRTPNPDLFWNDFFRIYNTLDEFEEDKSNVKSTCLVFIIDPKIIWTNNEYWIVQNEKYIPDNIYYINSESTSEEISAAIGGLDGFRKLQNEENLSTRLKVGAGNVVSVTIIKPNEDSLLFNWSIGDEWVEKLISYSQELDEFSLIETEIDVKNLQKEIESLKDIIGYVTLGYVKGETLCLLDSSISETIEPDTISIGTQRARVVDETLML